MYMKSIRYRADPRRPKAACIKVGCHAASQNREHIAQASHSIQPESLREPFSVTEGKTLTQPGKPVQGY